MSPPVRSVCVLWGRYGPYHTARLRALDPFLTERGVRLVALETASEDPIYAWDQEDRGGPLRWTTLFPARPFASVDPRAMAAAATAALDRADPGAVAVPSYSSPDSRAALAWCRRRRRVAVMMFDSRREDAPREGWREAVKRALVRQFDAALVAGTPQRAYAEELGIPTSHVFTPLDVVDNARFAAGAAAARGGASPERFLVVARLLEVKGVADLLDAYARYRRQSPAPWPLSVVGDGPERGALERIAPPGVTFEGFVQADALPAHYGRAGALILPSRKDTWGLVVNEAMAAGLPVVVSTGAGCALDLVEPGRNGFRCPPADPAALAERLARVATLAPDAREAMGARSREIIAGYGLDAFCEGLWAAVLAGRSRADRGLSLPASLLIGAMHRLARRPRSFNAVPD